MFAVSGGAGGRTITSAGHGVERLAVLFGDGLTSACDRILSFAKNIRASRCVMDDFSVASLFGAALACGSDGRSTSLLILRLSMFDIELSSIVGRKMAERITEERCEPQEKLVALQRRVRRHLLEYRWHPCDDGVEEGICLGQKSAGGNAWMGSQRRVDGFPRVL